MSFSRTLLGLWDGAGQTETLKAPVRLLGLDLEPPTVAKES